METAVSVATANTGRGHPGKGSPLERITSAEDHLEKGPTVNETIRSDIGKIGPR
jgi:hypothetical protein